MTLNAGAHLGCYEILTALGAGGMGEVYRAYDSKLGRDVAVKVLPARTVGDSVARERLLREARTASKLNHPHICTVHDVGEADGQVYVVMELVDGRPLTEETACGPLPVEKTIQYGLQLADALAHAHSRGIVHRDLKPANVIVTPEGRVKVLDFGLAKRVGGPDLSTLTREATISAPGTIAGTVAYMSPEQLRGQEADRRSDIWALGVVLYEMCAGRRPFEGTTDFELSASILGRPPRDVEGDVPPALHRAIARCLEKDPNARYQQASEVQATLEVLRAGTPMLTASKSVSARVWIGAAAVLIAAIAAAFNVQTIRTWMAPHGSSSPIRLAVLPFANLTGNSDQDYLSDGLTTELIAQLGRLHPQGLRVIARTSVMRYKNTDVPVDRIGQELNVDYVLEGTARFEADRIRVTTDLIRASDQTQVWSDTSERELAGILALQNDVARGVANSLAIALLPAEQRRLASTRVINPEAYELYLRGRFYWYKMTPQDLDTARSYFERAIQKDPQYAAAYIGLADAIGTPAHAGWVPTADLVPRAIALTEKALALDDTAAEAHDMHGRLKFAWDWDWKGAEAEFQRAIALNPNYPDAHTIYAQLLASTHRFDEALVEAQRGLDLDPHNPFYLAQYATALEGLHRFDDAADRFRKIARAEPNSPIPPLGLWDVNFLKGSYAEAASAARSLFTIMDQREIADAITAAESRSGYSAAMLPVARALENRSTQTYVAAIDLAQAWMHAGRPDRALDYIEKAVSGARDTRVIYVIGDPLYEDVWSHPRFVDVFRRKNVMQ